jgi:hypothetical protein
MRVIPQADGALHIEQPDRHTTYDMGNQRLYASFTGRGDSTRVLLVEGQELGSWCLQIAIDGHLLSFDRGRAIGRLWELAGEHQKVDLNLSTFLEEDSPVVFQRVQVRNTSAQDRRLRIAIDLDLAPDTTLRQRLRSWIAYRIPRLPGLSHLWGKGWAKPLLPSVPGQVRLQSDGRLAAQNGHTLFWGATQPPIGLKRGRKHRRYCRRIEYEFLLAPDEARTWTWMVGVGDAAEYAAVMTRSEQALTAAHGYARWLSTRVETGDALLQSMFVAGLNNAIAGFKDLPGGFSGLVAGAEYAYPPRLYFRDGYWTAQILMRFRPDLVRRHLLSLVQGVHADGQCPSAVFAPYLVEGWGGRGPDRLDWLPDHYDAPPYLVLLLSEYVQITGQWEILDEKLPQHQTVWHAVRAVVQYLVGLDADGDGLIEKPYSANDWADNVRRSIWVTYDQVLYTAALKAAAAMADCHDDRELELFCQIHADTARKALVSKLWDNDQGHFVNYRRSGFVEDHLSIDTLLAVHYGLTTREQTQSILAAARQLQTWVNDGQPYGDWGVMCVYPPYRRQSDLFNKSADPYHYHNGADWPYWDGVYGLLLRRAGDPDWREVLTRWWAYSLEQGWLTPVEYYSPPYPVGGMLNGWSSMPAAALVM